MKTLGMLILICALPSAVAQTKIKLPPVTKAKAPSGPVSPPAAAPRSPVSTKAPLLRPKRLRGTPPLKWRPR